MRSGNTASMRPRRVAAKVGEAPPVEIATTTSSRSTIAGRMKSQRAGRSATFTGTPRRLGDPLGDRIVIEIAGGDEDGGRAAQIVDPDVRKLPHLGAGRARQGGATVGGGPLAHHHDPAA